MPARVPFLSVLAGRAAAFAPRVTRFHSLIIFPFAARSLLLPFPDPTRSSSLSTSVSSDAVAASTDPGAGDPGGVRAPSPPFSLGTDGDPRAHSGSCDSDGVCGGLSVPFRVARFSEECFFSPAAALIPAKVSSSAVIGETSGSSAHDRSSHENISVASLFVARASAPDAPPPPPSPNPRTSYAACALATVSPACHDASSKTSNSVSSWRSLSASASARWALTPSSHATSSLVALYNGAGPHGANRPLTVCGRALTYSLEGLNPVMEFCS
mmetsp:Transcript_111665/g.271266  ORF Transcript_111665/g.271266 Transcript_111665/m.271266 type:complete len:270 (+) Transcript_111665:1169-1978(+)